MRAREISFGSGTRGQAMFTMAPRLLHRSCAEITPIKPDGNPLRLRPARTRWSSRRWPSRAKEDN